MAGLELKNIYKIYPGDVVAVKDFCLKIEDKEFIVFVGPSGCGKSTTLRMIAGLEDISEGELYIDGQLVNEMEPKERDIAMVFQSYALYPHMNVYENMAFALKLRKMPKDEIDQKVNEAAKSLELTDLLKRKPKELSGGQRQRVALGRAIVRNPKIFLMDEPLSNLDTKLRVQMRREISMLHEKLQTTFIYVTHDQVEAMTMGTRIVVMKDGIVQQVATPKDLYDKPVNKFVAGFIGSPQMNFVNTAIQEGEDGVEVSISDSKVLLADARFKELGSRENVILGIRPEHLKVIEDGEDYHFEGKIEHCELMGSETYIHFKIKDGSVLVARVEGSKKCPIGTLIKLKIRFDKLHIFDMKTENSINFGGL